MSIEALVFDVDGTLADTEETHRVAFNGAFAQAGLPWHWEPAEYKRLLRVTGGKERLVAWIGSLEATATERKRWLERVPELHAEKTRLYAQAVHAGAVPLRIGVRRLLGEALDSGLRLAIASTSTAAAIDALLSANLGPNGLGMFDVIACGDQVRAKKPAPDVYNLALDTLGVSPHRALALEDSANGLLAATAAGLWTVVTPNAWTDEDDFTGAGLVLPHCGDPDHPLPGEPGRSLRLHGWLTADELVRLAMAGNPEASGWVGLS